MKRSVTTALLVTVMGIATLWWGTDGLRAYTSEAARRLAVLREPRPMPEVVLEDQDGRLFRLQDYRGKLLAIEFIYVNCPSVCTTLGQSFQQILNNVPAEALGRDIVLLSISFDPARDTPPRLKDYARRFGADGHNWRIARIQDEEGLRTVLEIFGIIVIPDEFGGYEHNAALHLVDGTGRLALIVDYNQPLQFAAEVKLLL